MITDNRNVSIRIKEISMFAEELRTVLDVSLETNVSIELYENKVWCGRVFPSILILDNKAIPLTHSYHANSLDALLKKMIEGTKEELHAAKEGKGRCLR